MDDTRPDQTQTIINATIVLLVLTAVFIFIRIWARFGILRTLGLDDALILVAWVISLGYHGCMIGATTVGLGRHYSTVSADDYRKYNQIRMALSSQYSWCMSLAKMSFAVLYLRLLPDRKLSILNKCIIWFVLAQAIEETCVVVFRCNPIPKAWLTDLAGTCADLRPLWYITFIFNVGTDLILFIQPIPSMWKLQLPLAKRIGLIAMLSLGLLVTAISAIRIKNVINIASDDTYDFTEPLVWSAAEIDSAIICSCIPSLRQVAATIPGINSALGLSSAGDSRRDTRYAQQAGSKGFSIALSSKANGKHKDRYIQSQKSKVQSSRRSAAVGGGNHQHHSGLGTVSHATAARRGSEAGGSTDEIFPHKSDASGGIIVTNELVQDVETGRAAELSRSDQAVPRAVRSGPGSMMTDDYSFETRTTERNSHEGGR